MAEEVCAKGLEMVSQLEQEKRTETQLYYELQLPDQLVRIIVDLNANSGRFELLKNRVIFQYNSLSLARQGELLMSAIADCKFVAFLEYDTGIVEAVYYCEHALTDAVEEAMKAVACDLFFDEDDNGRYLTQYLFPDGFFLLSAMTRQLCNFVSLSRKGSCIFAINGLQHRPKSIEDTIKEQGFKFVKDSKGGISIYSEIIDLELNVVHTMLASLFVSLDEFGISITSVEFDLPKNVAI